jgi:CSLREA domain-containing protein
MKTLPITILLLLVASRAHATVFNIADGDVTALKSAITSANSNALADVINLAPRGTYKATTTDNMTNGDNAFPVVASDNGHALTINGNGATIDGNGSRVLQIAAGADVTVNSLIITNGRAISGSAGTPAEGGGILNFGSITLNRCTVSNSRSTATMDANGSDSKGGGLSNHGNCTLNGCTVSGNSAVFVLGAGTTSISAFAYGGGINNDGTLALLNCTVSGNVVTGEDAPSGSNHFGGDAYGGGVNNRRTATATNCTIASNSATGGKGDASGASGLARGGGVMTNGSSSSPFSFENTIVALNNVTGNSPTGYDVYGAATSQGHNLISNGDGSSGWISNSDIVGNGSNVKDPHLGPLRDNDGPAQTIALLTGSPAIDAGDDAVLGAPVNLTSDERGFRRKIGAHVDIGAFEFDPPQTGPGFIVTNTADHDDLVCGVTDCTLREATKAANAASGANTITFAAGLAGTITLTGGELLLTDTVTITGPGANVLVVDANSTSRVLRTSAPSKAISISGLTLTRGLTIGAAGAAGQGGCIYNESNLTLTDCTISGGSAVGGAMGSATEPGEGGGIFNAGANGLTVVRCTVSGNAATGGNAAVKTKGVRGGEAHGAALFNGQDSSSVNGVLTLQNCTISGNAAHGGRGSHPITGSDGAGGNAFGGGVYNAGSLVFNACTVTANSASGGTGGDTKTAPDGTGAGGGLGEPAVTGATAQLLGTIVAGNTSTTGSPDVNGSVTSQGFNLIGQVNGSSGFTASGDQTGTVAKPLDPKLGPLADNAGPTLTHMLLAGSPAIDASNAGLTTDQRGLPRPYNDPSVTNVNGGNASDIGAVEQQPLPTPTPTPTATPTPKPTPTATPKPTVKPTATPRPTATATPKPSATPSETPTPTPKPTATPSSLANISTRLRVETGENVLIGGFIVTGTQQKKVLIRAIGPSLPVSGALANPTLELYSGNTLLEFNDNWVDSLNKRAIIDTTVPPQSTLESAIVRSLPANNSAYTAIVRGVNGGTGVGLVEVFDLDTSVDSKLANISTRGLVQTLDNVMIGGFIVLNGNQKVIVRAIGPSLPASGALQDPVLELHNSNGAVLQTNDNWKTGGQQAEIIATTVPPTNDRESAIVRTLTPGNYTAVVRGVNQTTGVALVEVFALN